MAETTVASLVSQAGGGTLQALQDALQQRVERQQKEQDAPEPASAAASTVGSSLADNGRAPRVESTREATDGNSVQLSQEAIDRFIEERQSRTSGSSPSAQSSSSVEPPSANPLQRQINDLLGDDQLRSGAQRDPLTAGAPGAAEPGARSAASAVGSSAESQPAYGDPRTQSVFADKAVVSGQQQAAGADRASVGNGVDILGNRPVDKLRP